MFTRISSAVAALLAPLSLCALTAGAATPDAPAPRAATPTAAAPDAATLRRQWRSADEGTLELVRFAMAREVDRRQPRRIVERCPVDGERVYAHITVLNKGPTRHVTMIWSRDGKLINAYLLRVGRSPGWKTWSYKRATAGNAGRWTVEVRSMQGELLGRRSIRMGE